MEGVDRARLEAFGTFMEAKEQDWRKDKYIRVRFCNKMGFPTKHRHTDFEKFIVEAEADSIALSGCVELNLSAKGIAGLADVAKNVQKRSKATLVPALDPLKIHKSKDFLKGGLATWMPSHMAGRHTSNEVDRHRRWITHRFATATNDISIILAYRVCSGTIDSSTSTIANREQQSLLMAKHPSALNVRKAFHNDLSACLKKERDEGRDVLVLGDFNSPNDHQEIVDMFAQHDMVDLVPNSAPPTCTRSAPTSRPTEVAFGTTRFEQSMVTFGIHPQFMFDGSDHRSMEIAFDKEALLGDTIPLSWTQPSINANHPKQVQTFVDELLKLHRKGKTLDALLAAEEKLKSNDPDVREEGLKKVLNIEKRAMTEYIASATRAVLKPRSSIDIPWSIELATAKKARIAAKKEWERDKANDAAYNKWMESKRKHEDAVVKAPELRKKMYNSMVEEMAYRMNCSQDSAIRAIYNCEMTRDLCAKNRTVLKGIRGKSMTHILVGEPVESLKTQWMKVTDSEVIEDILLRFNERHLQQSTISPFTHGPLRDILGEDGKGSQEFLDGLVASEVAEEYGHLADATKLIIEEMKMRTIDGEPAKFEWTFNEADFEEAFGKARLNTAPGFSGLNMHVLRALTTNKELREIYAKLLELPFRYGFTYPRWEKTIQSLLMKETLPFVHRWRILELMEQDYNGVLKLIVGRKFAAHDQRYFQNRESYGAVKKKSAHDALNSVQNVLEYSRIMRQPIAIAPKDATGCFDLLRREIIKVIQESKGMPKEFGECVVQTLHGMERHIRLAGKLSKKSFKYTTSNNIGGIGQGSGEGPQDGNDMIGLLKDVHAKTTRGCTLLHPNGEHSIVRHGGGFIDDQIDVISLDSQEAINEKDMVEGILLHWQNLLNVSGGDLSINKCAVGFAQYKFVKSLRRDYAVLKGIDENEAQIELQPHNLLLAKEVIKRLGPHEGEKYLGVRNAISGSNRDEFKARKEQVADMAGRVATSNITRQQAYMIHSIQYKPAIVYPLQHTTFTDKQCKTIQTPMVNALLPKMGFNRHMPRAVVFGPSRYGGIELITLETEQLASHLDSLVKDLRTTTLQSEERSIVLAAYQRYMGCGKHFLENDPSDWPYKPVHSKTTYIWSMTWKHGISIRSSHFWVPQSSFSNDEAIMDGIVRVAKARRGTAQHLSDDCIANANTVRIYLRVHFLSDMVVNGKIDEEIFRVERRRDTSEVYPQQEYPSAKAISDWKRAVRAAFIYGDMGIGIDLTERESNGENIATDLQEYIQSQPHYVRQIMGQQSEGWSKEDTQEIVKALQEGRVVTIFGDGSVKEGRGSHAYRIIPHEDIEQQKGSITAGAVTNGDSRWITSLRTEQMSQLGALYALYAIAVTSGIVETTSTFLFRYDNQESLRRIKLVETFYTDASPLATDHDVWAEIARVCEQFPNITVEESWVKGHQDDGDEEITPEAQHNIDMDALAEQHRESTEVMPLPPFFVSEKAQILLGGIPVTQGFHQQLRLHLQGEKLHKYIMGKTGWSQHQFDTVNWEALERYMKTVAPGKRTNIIKAQHGWHHTCERDAMFKETSDFQSKHTSTLCPFGCGESDYRWHFLRCNKSPIAAEVTRELSKLKAMFKRYKVQREMQSILLQRIKATLQRQRLTPMQLHDSTDPVLQAALDEQDVLGWDQFLLGRQSKRWEEVQQKEYSRLASQLPKNSKLPAHYKATVFSKMLIQESTYIALNRWQVHNEVAHTAITAKEYIRDRDKAKKKIQKLLAESRPDHIAFTRQIPVTTESLLSQPLDRMRDWIATWTATKAYLAPSLITTYTTT
ncbi:hypothetical protein CTEN210_04279 [Chaetoceros tenuissimus]|uniref:Uncharacterized protein n=1 Tax=Chaetoceros tenuissimus TaxID=426638 RepID=A0AAD3CLJ7_9STRA|nr:hypothetical protein CTEN210_04279 [Chaetoceros tenuissimus]